MPLGVVGDEVVLRALAQRGELQQGRVAEDVDPRRAPGLCRLGLLHQLQGVGLSRSAYDE